MAMSIIRGLSGKIEEVVDELPDGNRLRLRFEIKRTDDIQI